MKVNYPYSNELNASISSDYDMAELALSGKLKSIVRLSQWQTKKFRSKSVQIDSKRFEASDGMDVSYYEFTPSLNSDRYPAIIYYHGGGFMFPIQKMMMEMSCRYAENCGVKVFLPEYRIVPDVSCDRVLDDCYEMLKYVFEHADELRVDPDKIIIYGDSAGGSLAACMAIRNRDNEKYPIKGQMLIYPVCDDESDRYLSMDKYEYAVWSKKSNRSMWDLYLHNGCRDKKAAVPMKNDCHDLPQCYIEPQQLDVLRDEALTYSDKLQAAGVEVECNLISGSFHGFDAQFKSPLVQRVLEHRYHVIRSFLL